MQGQPDGIHRHGFHPVPGIGWNQKKVAGFQSHITRSLTKRVVDTEIR